MISICCGRSRGGSRGGGGGGGGGGDGSTCSTRADAPAPHAALTSPHPRPLAPRSRLSLPATLRPPHRTRARSRPAPACFHSDVHCTLGGGGGVGGVLRQAWVSAAAYALAPPLLLGALKLRLAAASSSWAWR